MKVKELITQLLEQDQELEVVIYDYNSEYGIYDQIIGIHVEEETCVKYCTDQKKYKTREIFPAIVLDT